MTRAEERRKGALQRALRPQAQIEEELGQLDRLSPRQRAWMRASVFRYYRQA